MKNIREGTLIFSGGVRGFLSLTLLCPDQGLMVRQTDRQLKAHKGICFTAGWRASDVVTDISLHRHFPSPGRLWRSHWSSLRLTTYLRQGRCVSVSAIRKYRGHLQLLWHPQGFLHYNIDIAPTLFLWYPPLMATLEIFQISNCHFIVSKVFQGCSHGASSWEQLSRSQTSPWGKVIIL